MSPHLPHAATSAVLRRFVERGGSLIASGDAALVGRHLGLPVSYPLLARRPDAHDIPGSILRVAVDATSPIARGFGPAAHVMFTNSPVFKPAHGVAANGVRPIAWFDTPSPLRSGWAIGEDRLEGFAIGVEAPLGRGRVVLFGPDITFRAQSHGTFKFLFNAIHYSKARQLS